VRRNYEHRLRDGPQRAAFTPRAARTEECVGRAPEHDFRPVPDLTVLACRRTWSGGRVVRRPGESFARPTPAPTPLEPKLLLRENNR
jgi:hypothetical protein